MRKPKPGSHAVVSIPAVRCHCARCGHVWTAVGDAVPVACAGCKSRSWQTAAGTVPKGRPRKDAAA